MTAYLLKLTNYVCIDACEHMPTCVFVFRAGTEIVSRAARDRVNHYLDSLKQYFAGFIHFSTCT